MNKVICGRPYRYRSIFLGLTEIADVVSYIFRVERIIGNGKLVWPLGIILKHPTAFTVLANQPLVMRISLCEYAPTGQTIQRTRQRVNESTWLEDHA
jgi:hypothetical protein